MKADDLRALLDATQPSCKTLDLVTDRRTRDRTADAEDAIADAIAESIATGGPASRPWSREMVEALERHPDLDVLTRPIGCEAEASGTTDGRTWAIFLYNGAEG